MTDTDDLIYQELVRAGLRVFETCELSESLYTKEPLSGAFRAYDLAVGRTRSGRSIFVKFYDPKFPMEVKVGTFRMNFLAEQVFDIIARFERAMGVPSKRKATFVRGVSSEFKTPVFRIEGERIVREQKWLTRINDFLAYRDYNNRRNIFFRIGNAYYFLTDKGFYLDGLADKTRDDFVRMIYSWRPQNVPFDDMVLEIKRALEAPQGEQ